MNWRAVARSASIPLALFAVAFAARLASALHAPDPAYADSSYYIDAARSLAAGHGFSINAIWTFVDLGDHLPAVGSLPVPSFGHWAPLAALVQVPFIWLLGASALVSDLPFILAGAALAPLAFFVARDAGVRRELAIYAGLFVALPGALLPFLGQADNFALYGLLAGLALWLAARGLRAPGGTKLLAGAGLLAGLATLARTDGILLAAALAFAWLLARRRGRLPLRGLLVAGALFALVVVPWELRQLATWGVLSPSTASGRVFFIRDIGEWDSLTVPATLDHLLSWGLGPLLLSRLTAFAWLLGDILALLAGLVLAPFLVVGCVARLRGRGENGWVFGPVALYMVILAPFSVLLAAAHVAGGTFLHSATSLVPWIALLSVEGIAIAANALVRRRPNGNPFRAQRVFVVIALAGLSALSLTATLATQAGWSADARVQRSLAAVLSVVAVPDEPVMAADAASTLYWSGHPAVVLVRDSLSTVHTVATTYHIRWLILRRADDLATSDAFLNGALRPTWLGPPVVMVDADGAILASAGSSVDSALFPVCLVTGDTRCSP